jgi:hypothetical protein
MGFPPQQPSCPLATVLSLQRPSPFCHPDRSEAEGRNLRFCGPFLEMFFPYPTRDSS